MTDEILAFLIAIAILFALFVWVPTLGICNERCQKLLRGWRQRKAVVAPESSAATHAAAVQDAAVLEERAHIEAIKVA